MTDDERIEQIRLAQASARPTHQNPAWLNCHGDCNFLLKQIDRLRADLDDARAAGYSDGWDNGYDAGREDAS